jgi:hypothetical protein
MTITDIIQTILLAVVILQLWVSHRSFQADHERRKKQATFEYVNAVSERFRTALNRFDEKHGIGTVVDISNYDDDDRFIVKSYLNEIEYICAGVNAGVFDLEILHKMMGSGLIGRHHRFQQYINEKRQTKKTTFVEFSEVVRNLETLMPSDYSNVGKITKS